MEKILCIFYCALYHKLLWTEAVILFQNFVLVTKHFFAQLHSFKLKLIPNWFFFFLRETGIERQRNKVKKTRNIGVKSEFHAKKNHFGPTYFLNNS